MKITSAIHDMIAKDLPRYYGFVFVCDVCDDTLCISCFDSVRDSGGLLSERKHKLSDPECLDKAIQWVEEEQEKYERHRDSEEQYWELRQ